MFPLLACVENELLGKNDGEADSPPVADSAGGTESGHTGAVAGRCALEPSAAETAAALTTCADGAFAPPALALELEVDLGTEPLIDAGIAPSGPGAQASFWVAAWGGASGTTRLYEINGGGVVAGRALPWRRPNRLAVGRPSSDSAPDLWILGNRESDDGAVAMMIRLDIGTWDWCERAVDDDAQFAGDMEGAPALSDADGDARPDTAMAGEWFDADCLLAWRTLPDDSTVATPASMWAVGSPTTLISQGGHGRADGFFQAWDWPVQDPADSYAPTGGALVTVAGEVVFAGIGPTGPAVLGEDGSLRWLGVDPGEAEGNAVATVPSIIDVTGDGEPDFLYRGSLGLYALRHDGSVAWGPVTEVAPQLSGLGSTVATDLDADGRPELVDQSPGGVELRDATTGALLDADLGIAYMGSLTGPLVADLDNDESMEIVVLGWNVEGHAVVRVYGPSEGRWARGRPVWHQRAYDITSIRDDGTIISFPEPSWVHYNSFRYQPPHDGAYPDLVPVLVETCAESCDTTEGYVQVSVAAENLGSVAAMEGAQLVVYAYTASDGLRELDRATLGETIEPSKRSSSVVFTLDSSDWGNRRVIEVVPAHEDECDWVNNRIEPWDDPCATP